jgi:hypothetical protein
MKLIFRKDDGVDLVVTAGDPRFLTCTGPNDATAECMASGIRAFQTVYSTALLGPSKVPVAVDTMATVR